MIAGYEKEENACLRYSHTRLSGVSGQTEILPPFGCRNDKTTFCYRQVLQQQVKRSIAVGYAVWVAKSKTSQ